MSNAAPASPGALVNPDEDARRHPQAAAVGASFVSELSGPDVGYRGTAAVLLVTAVGFVLWRAWACDDAFITFRHVANCLLGHGPVFNVGERVQGFSHPLWFLLLLVGSIFLDVYVVAIIAGLISTAAIVLLLAILLRHRTLAPFRLLAAVAVLISSPTFVVYQTSGLENSLTSLLIAILFGWSLYRVERGDSPPVRIAAILCSLLILNRPDHVFFCTPIVLGLCVLAIRACRWRGLLLFLPAVVPLALWYGFATIYYGTPLPNTVYAKVALPLGVALSKGSLYVWDYARCEPFHALLIAAVPAGGAVVSVRDLVARRRHAGIQGCFVLALWIHIIYVMAVGGDFMRGRFLASTLVSAVVLGCHLLNRVQPSRELTRPVTAALAAGLVIVCYENAGRVLSPSTCRIGFESLQEQAFIAPIPVAGLVAALLALVVWGMVHLGRDGPGRRGPRVFAIAAAAAAIYLVATIGQWQPPWAALLLLAVALGVGAYLLGLLAGGSALHARAALVTVTLLLAMVSSLCDLDVRSGPISPGTDISDEYRCFAESWDRNRFRRPIGKRNGCVRTLVLRGDRAARYAKDYGPIALELGSIGFASYYAGPNVHVIDRFGLTDAFVARLPADPASRIGHMEHRIPAAYLRSLGVVNELPRWEERLRRLDPTLAADARAMMSSARWEDAASYQQWLRVRRMISGDLFSWDRLAAIPAYALGRR